MARPKFIVTGLCGLIGSHLKARYGGECDLVPIDIVEGVDLTDPAQVGAVVDAHKDADGIIHLAAFTDVSGASAQEGNKEGLCYRLNVTGTENVVRAAEQHGMHVVHVSTDFVFDGLKEGEYTEEDEPNPIEWYGETKFLAEKVVEDSGIPATIMRIAFPYVPGDAAREDLVAKIRSKLAAGETAKLFDDQMITPTYAGDIVSALHLLATKRPAGELFHVTGSTSLSPYGLGLAVARAFELDTGNVEASSMVEYLKIDPRPRQQFMRIGNNKYGDFAEAHGGTRPLEIAEGLRRIRESLETGRS